MIARLLTACLELGQAPPSAPTPPAAGEVLTVEDAVTLALAHNRALARAELEEAKAVERLAKSRADLFPTFDFTALETSLLRPLDFRFEKGSFGDFPATGPIPDADTTIRTETGLRSLVFFTATQPLSQLYRIRLGMSIARLDRDTASAALDGERGSLVERVRKAYYAALEAESGLAASAEAVALYHEVGRTVQARLGQDAALPADELEVKARLASAEHQQLVLGNALLSRKEELNLLLGRELATAFELSSELEPLPYDGSAVAAAEAAVAASADVRQARLRVEQAVLGRRLEKAGYIPDVSLSLTHVNIPGGEVDVVPRSVTSAGLLFSVEPWDWGRRAHAVREKTQAVEQARSTLADSEDRARLDARRALRELEEGRSRVGAARADEEAQRERLRVARSRFAAEAALLEEVLRAESALEESVRARIQAVLAFASARAGFDRVVGAGGGPGGEQLPVRTGGPGGEHPPGSVREPGSGARAGDRPGVRTGRRPASPDREEP